jgi:hypothetical protein
MNIPNKLKFIFYNDGRHISYTSYDLRTYKNLQKNEIEQLGLIWGKRTQIEA